MALPVPPFTPTLLLRDQIAKEGEWLARMRAAIVKKAYDRVVVTTSQAEWNMAMQIIRSPDNWAVWIAQLVASAAPGIGLNTGTNAAGGPLQTNTANADLVVTAIVDLLWDKLYTVPAQ
jgi:hypothetical protein